MTYKQIYAMIGEIAAVNSGSIPYAYYQFPETGQQPPFICFFYSQSNDVLADNTNYQKVEHLVVELYTDNKDFATEATIEAALNSSGLVYAREESYIDTERMYMVTYMTEIVITEELNNGQ